MNRWLLTCALVCSLMASAAPQAEAKGLQSARAAAAAAREASLSLRSQQQAARGELNALAARIETLKTQAKGKLTVGSELDGALKKSQELSGQLTGLAQSLAGREAELESANVALLGELSNELSRLRQDFDRQTDRVTRKATIDKLRQVRRERDQVRASLPAAKVPALDAVRPSDDPEDLLEQADALKDNEDRVREQLRSLERRIAEAKEERELDGRVRQFLSEDSLFDEQDRRLRLQQRVTEAAAAANTTKTTAGEAPQTSGAATDRGASDFSAAGPQGAGAPQTAPPPVGNNAPVPAAPQANPAPPATHVVSGSDARPVIGQSTRATGRDDDDLEELEIQRRKLTGLAEQLKVKAAELERQARQLK